MKISKAKYTNVARVCVLEPSCPPPPPPLCAFSGMLRIRSCGRRLMRTSCFSTTTISSSSFDDVHPVDFIAPSLPHVYIEYKNKSKGEMDERKNYVDSEQKKKKRNTTYVRRTLEKKLACKKTQLSTWLAAALCKTAAGWNSEEHARHVRAHFRVGAVDACKTEVRLRH